MLLGRNKHEQTSHPATHVIWCQPILSETGSGEITAGITILQAKKAIRIQVTQKPTHGDSLKLRNHSA